jgi:hypothetical protein
MVFLAFGVGLDPRQREVFGPALGPIFVGIIVGGCSFLTGISRDGYTGFCTSSFAFQGLYTFADCDFCLE